MVELERERLDRQRRIEDAVTSFYLAAEKRDAAAELLQHSEQGMATALRLILDEGTDVERAAILCDLAPTEVRQLTRRRVNGRSHSTASDDRNSG
jgi:hypothetical protein